MTTEELEKSLALGIDNALATETPRLPKIVPKAELSLADHVGKHIDIAMKLRDQLRVAITNAEASRNFELADLRANYTRQMDALKTKYEADMLATTERHTKKLTELAELRQRLDI